MHVCDCGRQHATTCTSTHATRPLPNSHVFINDPGPGRRATCEFRQDHLCVEVWTCSETVVQGEEPTVAYMHWNTPVGASTISTSVSRSARNPVPVVRYTSPSSRSISPPPPLHGSRKTPCSGVKAEACCFTARRCARCGFGRVDGAQVQRPCCSGSSALAQAQDPSCHDQVPPAQVPLPGCQTLVAKGQVPST